MTLGPNAENRYSPPWADAYSGGARHGFLTFPALAFPGVGE